ncbi:MAG: DegT/DnrJ/EryC1/StrS family aminotransferase [Limisphaerales bacterium]
MTETSAARPAFDGGKPVRETFLPFCTPFIGDEEKAEVIAALESGWLSTGPRVKRFEEEAAAYLGTRNAIGISSCTAGLHVALVAAGIGAGDEVITSPLTFVATANVVLHTGARPVFADVEPDTYNVSVEQIARKITPRTKAIIPVHYAGQPCDMDAIMDLARKHNLLVIEDAAHAIGTKYHDRQIGSWEDRIAVFSFYATKTMTTGEGGLIATGLDELAAKMRILGTHGISHDAWKRYSSAGKWYYEVLAPGYKYNLTDVQAALGLCQFKRLEGFIERREEICQRYDRAFAARDCLTTPYVAPGCRHSRHLYPLLVEEKQLRIDRAQFIDALRAENIGTSVHFIPVHLQPYYRDQFGFKRGDYPVAESIYDRLISLPLYPHMSDDDVDDVIAAVRRIAAHYQI